MHNILTKNGKVIDTTKCLVVHILIDYRTSVFKKGTNKGFSPNVVMFSSSVKLF